MRVVLDTNVVVSALLAPRGAPARLVEAWRAGRLTVLVSPPILEEYARVLAYRKIQTRLGLTSEEIRALVGALAAQAEVVVEGAEVEPVADDPSDTMFVTCAVAGGAGFLVSGDEHLLALGRVQGVEILPPAALTALLDR